jgi:tetratricopeptide (TPR) repeat protein
LFQSTFRHADILSDENKPSDALRENKQAEALMHQLADKHPENGEYHYLLGFITAKIGSAYKDDKRYDEALDQFRTAVGIAQRLAADHPDNSEWQALVPSTMSRIGDVLVSRPQPDLMMMALRQYDAAMAYQRSLITAFPGDAVINTNFTTTLRSRAKALSDIGQWAEAEAQFDEAIRRREPLLATDKNSAILLSTLAIDYRTFIQALLNRANLVLAEVSELTPDQRRLLVKAHELAEKEIVIRQMLVNIDPASKIAMKRLAVAKNTCDEINIALGEAKPDGYCFGETLAVRLFGPPDAARSLQSQQD